RRWNKLAGQPIDPAALELTRNHARAELERVYRDRTPEIIKAAKSEADRLIKHAPWLKIALEETPLGNDVWLVGTLANLAQVRAGTGE
ncbi:MAG: hypothetical protein PVG66_12715, partial [Chromatiales bacterium]